MEPLSAPPAPDDIRRILTEARTIAVVGWSPKPGRPSHGVGAFLKSRGYRVIPVNPGLAGQSFLGETVAASLAAIPQEAEVDMVDIFRRSEFVPPIVDEAIRIGAKAVWMQEGVVHEEAAAKARQAGLLVIMDRCILKEHRRLSR
jgi:predicted CoA-binding protein